MRRFIKKVILRRRRLWAENVSRMKSKREMKPERGMTLNIHVVFNNKMKSFILNRFQFNKKKKKKKVAETLQLPFRHREALYINHPRGTVKVKTKRRVTRRADWTRRALDSSTSLQSSICASKCSPTIHLILNTCYRTCESNGDANTSTKQNIHRDSVKAAVRPGSRLRTNIKI